VTSDGRHETVKNMAECKNCKECAYKREAFMREYLDELNPALMNFASWAERYLDGISAINAFIAERGDDAMIASLIHGSIGYFTVSHADNDLSDWKRGGMKSWCERADACFGCDRVAMYLYDIRCFEHCSPDKQARLIDFVQKARGLSYEAQLSASCAYPTSSI
jgi:hypothetical protein